MTTDLPHAEPLPRGVTFIVKYVQLYALTDINDLAQSFECQLYMQLRVPGGASDRDLLADRGHTRTDERPPFPIDETGRPTFRPGIMWYLSRLEFNNEISVERAEAAVMEEGADLICGVRWKGRFSEPLELGRFPFDAQPLTMQLIANNRIDGPMPIFFKVDPDVRKSVDPRNSFALHQQWRLYNDVLGVAAREYKEEEDRRFTSLEVSVLVERKAGFCLTNVALPTLMISLFTFLPFMVPKAGNETRGGRVETSMFLVFTVMAFKSSVRDLIPALSYLVRGLLSNSAPNTATPGAKLSSAISCGADSDRQVRVRGHVARVRLCRPHFRQRANRHRDCSLGR